MARYKEWHGVLTNATVFRDGKRVIAVRGRIKELSAPINGTLVGQTFTIGPITRHAKEKYWTKNGCWSVIEGVV